MPSHPPESASRRDKIVFYMKRYFRLVYPYVNAGWYVAILAWHLRYLFGRTDYYNPLFKIMGIRIQRLGPHDNVPCLQTILTPSQFHPLFLQKISLEILPYLILQ
jgi:peroxin-12